MKKTFVLFLAVFAILYFSFPAQAEGFTVSTDYCDIGIDKWALNFNALAFGAEYDGDFLLIGGSYLFALSYEPPPSPGIKWFDDLGYFYGGYKLFNGESSDLALIGNYFIWKNKEIAIDTWEKETIVSSIGLGAKGTVNLESIETSILALYGLSNKAEIFQDGVKKGDTDRVFLSYLEPESVKYRPRTPLRTVLSMKMTWIYRPTGQKRS